MSARMRRLGALLVTVTLALGLLGSAANAESGRDELFQSIRTVFEVVESYHKDGADLDRFVEGAIRGGLEALGDPYTNHFPKQEFAEFLNSLEGNLTGIGIYLDIDGDYVVVSAPIKNSPAAKAGLKTGDRILEVNGTHIVGAPIEKAQQLIRGDAGTTVRLKIERPLETRTFEVEIVRDVIHIPQVESKMLDQQVGYIALTSFGTGADKEFFTAVDDLKAQGAVSLVLDLRQNPGGYVKTAVSIAGAFVPGGQPVMYEVGRSGESVTIANGKPIGLPVAVLVDGGSASAAEILAGAIQDYGSGTLVGTKTFGKGTVQQILFMADKSGMKVTVAEYLTGKRRHVHGIGLTPDHVVEPPEPASALLTPMKLGRILSMKSVGLDVLDLQTRLSFLGYVVEQDGVMGSGTMAAVQSFRKSQGLEPLLVVDGAVVRELNEQVLAQLRAAQGADVQLQKAISILTTKR